MRALALLLTFCCAMARALGATHTVHIYDYYFTPTNLTVAVGDTVTWVNEVNSGHDTTQYDLESQTGLLWMSAVLARGESFSFKFTEVGFYPYVCATHIFTNPEQTGTVSVVTANVAPTVNIASPQNGASFSAPASFQITASPSDSDGTVASVEFFVNGTSQGTATGPGYSINVGPLGIGNYTLTAVATDNAGAAGSSPPVSITVTQANVVPGRFPLTVSMSPPGSGTIALEPPQPEGGYESNTVVTLTASANRGFAFTNWSGDASGTSNRIALTIDGNKTATANFATIIPPSYTLAISVTPTNGGTVLRNPEPRTNGTYAGGTVVAIAAVAERNFRFVGWSGSVTSTNNPLLVTMTADRTLTAQFEPLPEINFAVENGLYVGLLMEETNIALPTSGSFSLRVDTSGAFDGVANVGGKKQAIGGQFDRFGYAPLALRRGTLNGSLQITADKICGELTDGRSTPRLTLHPLATNAMSLAGVYRLTMPPNDLVSQPGTMTLTILPGGVAQVRGRLGDGSAFTQRTKLTANARVPLFAPLYGGRGGLLGWIDFPGDGAVGGTLRWMRPPDSRSENFPEGFQLETTVTNGAAE